MKSIREVFITVCFIILFQLSFSQVGVGQWRGHLPYSSGTCVAESNDKVFTATNAAVFSYDKTSGETEKLNKITALSDINVSTIAYNDSHDMLIIGYKNGNIDILKNRRITNISDIKRKTITAEKSINKIRFIDDYAILSTGFGIVVMDIERQEIKYTYYIGDMGSYIFVYDTEFDGEYLYAATDNGIYRGDYYNDNLADFNSWEIITNLPEGHTFEHLSNQHFTILNYFNGKLITNLHDTENDYSDMLYVFEDDTWSYFPDTSFTTTTHIASHENQLIVNKRYKLFFMNEDLETEYEVYTYAMQGQDNLPLYPIHFIPGKDHELLIADKNSGLVLQNSRWNHQVVQLNGPASSNAFDIDAQAGTVMSVAGGRNLSWTQQYRFAEINYFENQEWNQLTYREDTILRQLRDACEVAINPQNPSQAFIGMWGQGMLRIENGEIKDHYTTTNSSLTAIPDVGYIRIGGLAFDDDQNLWITNSSGTVPVHMRKPDGDWVGLNYSNRINESNIGDIIVTENDHKWIVLPRGNGIFAFDDNGTPENLDDDKTKKFNVTNEYGEIISNDIYSIAEDKNGSIWLGTSKGVVVFYNPEDVFDESIIASQVLIPRNDGSDNADILLGSEIVTAISVDGANKKWFGTQNGGVFKTSEDGITEIHHFNQSNSPLFSNNVLSLDIEPESGEVFIGTNSGIISFRGEATEGSEDYNKVYAFPNPVRPDYSGPITIHGLIAGSIVKITDVAGNLVFETRSEGGQALWDGKSINGNRVQTGVYLVFSANEDGTKSDVTKILFIN
ncbi:MAG: two-component regulator propeller domain-containing protein [Bacteroidota bacterium]